MLDGTWNTSRKKWHAVKVFKSPNCSATLTRIHQFFSLGKRMKSIYDKSFYESRDAATSYFADRLATVIADIFSPSSAVDLGCGVGTILRHLKMKGCSDIMGVEGPWLDTAHLVIAKDVFRHADLTKPLNFGRSFDVAISLEVAEHIDEEFADAFVDSLCRLSPRIVFSAAIPYQGGVSHVNERWQSYWADKFAERKYKTFDAIRPLVWNDKKVPTYYRQNTIIYLHEDLVAVHLSLAPFEVVEFGLLDRAHPDQYLAQVKNPMNVTYKQLLAYLPAATLAAFGRVAKRLIWR